MSKIFIEKKEIKFKVQETVEESSFDVIDGKYVENIKLNRKYIADIYSYLDFNVLFAMENLFDEFYIKIILFNDEKKVGYNLISLSNNLDISVKRVSPKNLLILGINKDQENQGQAAARNTGFKYVDAEYVNFADSDDYFALNALDMAIEILVRSYSTNLPSLFLT